MMEQHTNGYGLMVSNYKFQVHGIKYLTFRKPNLFLAFNTKNCICIINNEKIKIV